MARLVECWQVSQPPHLRHLAIVRDTTINRTITHYIHYSARNFSKLVDAGESSWEAVEFVARNAKTSTIAVPPIDEQPKLDAYGLPLDLPKSDLLNSGDCSLMDCVLVARPQNYLMSSSDPRAVELEDGTYCKYKSSVFPILYGLTLFVSSQQSIMESGALTIKPPSFEPQLADGRLQIHPRG
jgi:transcription factor C subunit 3